MRLPKRETMSIVSYELTYTGQIDTVNKICFNNVTLNEKELKKDFDPVNRKFKNTALTGVITNGLTIFIVVEASGIAGGEISMKVEVDQRNTVRYPIKIYSQDGNYSISNEYKLK